MAASQLNPAPPITTPNSSVTPPGSSFLGRNIGLIALVSLMVAAWMLVYTFTMFQPKYGAKATVIIKDSAITNRYVEPEQLYSVQTTTSTSSNPVLNTMGLLKSEAISDALWAYFSEKHPEELKRLKIKTQKEWESFYQDGSAFIKAKNQPGTDLISIQFSWAQPQIAKEGLTVVVKAFQDASRDLNKEEQISRTRFLSRQMGDIETKLQDIRKKKSAYESEKATVSVRRESDDLAGSRMELSNKLAQLQGQAQGKENLVRRYQQMLGMSSEKALRGAALGQNGTMVRLQDELYRLQQQHSLLSSSLTDANPKVREVQAQIDQVRANIKLEKDRIGAPDGDAEVVADSTRATLIGDMLRAQGEAQDLRAQAARIAQRLGQVNADIRSFPSTAVGLANLEQQENTLSTALDHLRQKVMEGKMKEAQTLSNVFIVDAPRLPEHPSFPNRTHLIVISLLMAAAAGVSVAFIKEQLFAGKTAGHAPAYPAYTGMNPDFEMENDAEAIAAHPQHSGIEPHVEPTAWPVTSVAPFPAAEPTAQAVSQEIQPAAQPASQAMQPALRNVPNTDDVLGVNPPIEKVEVPVSGSLFDSLLPIAGPMARVTQPTARTTPVQPLNADINNQTDELRRDLTQPLSIAEVAEPALQTGSVQSGIAHSNLEIYQDADLLPPTSPHAAHLQQVHVATQRLAEAFEPAPGVPVMHAAPSAMPSYQNDPLSVAGSVNEMEISANQAAPDEAIDEFPNLVLNETPAAFHAGPFQHDEFQSDDFQPEEMQVEQVQPDPATTLYEAQAKAMPLPRRRRVRSVPSFLLDERTIDVQADVEPEVEPAPYELIPRKQRAQVAEAPQPETTPAISQPETTANEAWFADLSPAPVAHSPNMANSDFPPMPTFVPKEFANRRPKKLFGGLFSSARKFRQPELMLGGHLHPRNR